MVEQFEGTARLAFGEHAGEFVADSFAADSLDFGRKRTDRGLRGRVDGEVETGGEADGAQHAQVVLFEATARQANGADYA